MTDYHTNLIGAQERERRTREALEILLADLARIQERVQRAEQAHRAAVHDLRIAEARAKEKRR